MRRIVRRPDLADTRVIVLITFERDEYVFDALRVVRADSRSRTLRRLGCWSDPNRDGRRCAVAVRYAQSDRAVRGQSPRSVTRTRSWPNSPHASERWSPLVVQGLNNHEDR
jgi:hypothetical protein